LTDRKGGTMGNSNILLKVLSLPEKKCSILIDKEYTDSFYNFLCDKEFKTSYPREAIYRTKSFYKDKNGVVRFNSEPTDMEIIVEATSEKIEPVVMEWSEQIKGT